jgi:tRNA(Arg) A34 adenosine deaminase TadA
VTKSDGPAPRPGQRAGCNPKLIGRLLDVIEREIVPLTQAGVRQGNKVFGAAILRKADLSTVVAGTNHETENPLWHGEIYTIKQYYEMVNADESKRHAPADSIFLTTHEPCTLCASAIAWGGYDNFYYLFSHEDSRDSFQIGHDLKILEQLFRLGPGEYARHNDYWTAYGIVDLIGNCQAAEKQLFMDQVERIRKTYAKMSAIYQAGKQDNRNIPLK